MLRVLAISGSLRAQSTNTNLLRAMTLLAPSHVEMEFYEELGQLPPFNPDHEGDAESGPLRRFRSAIEKAQVVVFSTPEYAHGIPGSLKNALDWIVGSGELSDKAVALLNASSRSLYAQAALKEVLKAMNARLLDRAERTVDLQGKKVSAADIASDPELSATLTSMFAELTLS